MTASIERRKPATFPPEVGTEIYHIAATSCYPHPLSLTMTSNSPSDPSSIFEGGKLKPGTYKIQNIQTENYLDIEVHSREVCCRPARDLGDGRGIVCRCLSFFARV
jgi:hypothetical protein